MGWGNPREIRPDAVALALSRHLLEDGAASNVIENVASSAQLGLFPSAGGGGDEGENVNGVSGAKCPECSGYLLHQEGCLSCPDCGYNKCE